MIPLPKMVASLTSDNNKHAITVIHPLGNKLVIESLQEYKNINSIDTIPAVLNGLPVQKVLVPGQSMFLFTTVRKVLKRPVTTILVKEEIDVVSCAQIVQLAYKSYTLDFLDNELEERFVKATSKRFDPKDIPVLLQSIYVLVPYLMKTPGMTGAQAEPPGIML